MPSKLSSTPPYLTLLTNPRTQPHVWRHARHVLHATDGASCHQSYPVHLPTTINSTRSCPFILTPTPSPMSGDTPDMSSMLRVVLRAHQAAQYAYDLDERAREVFWEFYDECVGAQQDADDAAYSLHAKAASQAARLSVAFSCARQALLKVTSRCACACACVCACVCARVYVWEPYRTLPTPFTFTLLR